MKKKKTLHLSKKRKRKTNRVSLPIKNIVSQFREAAWNRKTGNRKQMFLTFFGKYYGIGFNKIVNRVLRFLGISLNYKIKNFKKGLKNMYPIYTVVVNGFKHIGTIKENKFNNINLKQELMIFISYRHLLMLPVRGQRTKTHAKTRKIFHVD